MLFRNYIEGWSFFNISPAVARQPCKEVPELALGEAGEYLAAILHKLEKQNGEKGSLEQIVAGLRGAVPGFKSVRTKALEVEGKWTFQVVEDRIRGAINPRSVSDGTIRLLAMMVIAHWSARRSTLLAIEEPENGLHPHLSKHIVELLRTASETRQVLATTHNPNFLDELEPEEVILCDKKEGFTVVRRVGSGGDQIFPQTLPPWRTLGTRDVGRDTMTFGVGVEGPSDFQFWHKVLHKHFRGCRFDVRNMKNRDKLIRETPKLLETFRDCHYAAGFILVDLDDDPCLGSVMNLFDAAVKAAASPRQAFQVPSRLHRHQGNRVVVSRRCGCHQLGHPRMRVESLG